MKNLCSGFLILICTFTIPTSYAEKTLSENESEIRSNSATWNTVEEHKETNVENAQTIFTRPESDEIIEFEKEIAYFYGAKNPRKISQHYIGAIQELEKLGIQTNEELLKKVMINSLKKAYEEVQKQTSLKFNPDKAAGYEFQLILAQAKEESFEKIYQIMTSLYNEVFQSNTIAIHKAAMLRTFLYKYKISLLKKNNALSKKDQTLMRAIAKESEQELNNIIP